MPAVKKVIPLLQNDVDNITLLYSMPYSLAVVCMHVLYVLGSLYVARSADQRGESGISLTSGCRKNKSRTALACLNTDRSSDERQKDMRLDSQTDRRDRGVYRVRKVAK